ncbi:hypothetical protein N5F23_26490 [Pseudomonas sichuanensis]|uniref:hypothetical protein n=1 Tax=Pseudomonas sichuanensis TaxID=2213015 RepID=UPI0024473124|nr:hypothetical protein [Pseudomonas sichuanensis]MDH0734123.1 hypothetical protein [Pseudomonas sichuanensis]MDH1586151.1 hypothetical protein [Pseudomonas sichuanensis]MDH1595831.1 hypothetical protein [Pseudomonas sichuanensis]MDH1601072.1 hypothetical protein [Pseudomonas sichuanensis]
MRLVYCIFLLFLFWLPSQEAFSAWSCNQSYVNSYPNECQAGAGSATPEAFIEAAMVAARTANTSSKSNYAVVGCSATAVSTLYNCEYSYINYGKVFKIGLMIEGATAASCPETLESRGSNSSVTKTGDKYYVTWSVRSVDSDICHNSCSYLAESAAVSNCYLVAGSTDTGFCNYVVGLNSASPSCASEAGYTAPGTGDSLTSNVDPGDGGGDGSDGGAGDGGNTGGGNGGGSGDSGFDGELSFSAPGALDTDGVVNSELNAAHYKTFVVGMEADFNDSGIGKALTNFSNKISGAGQQGSCPTAQIQLLGTVVAFDAHCDLFSGISPILAVVFMAAWSLLAVRIFLSA